jgi:D-alanyl-lipoteichoic acid acyltransferase DltB (MBOAT superfamily)
MLFNSNEFILAFLPVTLAGFFGLGMISRTAALRWVIFASLVFYALWRPLNVLIIAPSILINYILARSLQRLATDERRYRAARLLLLLGIAFNIAFLGYFKYADFGVSTVNDIFGTSLVLTHVVLPLGISFITFQKIAFLIDVHAGRVRSFTLQDYCLFVLFFPQLIAGPIVHYREMMPQFHSAPCRFDKENVAVGLTLLFFGLFKKVVLADHIAAVVTPIYNQAASGVGTSLLLAWAAAIGFTLQIYFDFSGYTDMALGAARLFGIRLPQNYNSPLKASSIIDFWLRWHMTLTRFLTAYIYNPLTLWLTRGWLAKGFRGLAGPRTTIGAFAYLLMFPLLVTMFLSGLWHGAGYGFVVWGLIHGFYLTINHAWRLIRPQLWPDRASYERVMHPVGCLLTFVAVAVAMIFFRSPTITSASDLLKGLIGLNGVVLPRAIYDHLGPLAAWLHRAGVTSVAPELWSGKEFGGMMMWILLSMLIALGFPNTLQILARYEPALGVKPPTADLADRSIGEWNSSFPWAIGVSIVAAIAMFFLGGPSEFLYWQF